jgi:CheY-like chemotaxis protein
MSAPLIFVVDKNPIHRNLLKFRLETGRFADVQAFPSGEECLYRLHKHVHPDFLITSFFTGNYSGFEFLRQVQEISPSIRVIFFDIFEDQKVAEMLIDAGACDYFNKTRDPETGIAGLLKNLRYLLPKYLPQRTV